MRTLNVRLAAILLVSAAVFGGGVEGLRRYQVWRKADFYLDQADDAMVRAEIAREAGTGGDELRAYEDAVNNYGWYLSLRSNETNVSEKVGLLQADLAQITAANGPRNTPRELEETQLKARVWLQTSVRTLESVLREERSTDRMAARRKLAEIYLLSGRYSDAQTHITALLQKSPGDAGLLEMQGRCQEAVRETALAAESFQKAIRSAPDQVMAYILLAELLADPNRLNPLREADECMRNLLQANPDSFRAHLAYGEYLINLARATRIDDAGKHPILLDALVPTVLAQAVDRAVGAAQLADDDPDAALLAADRAILVQVVRDALKLHDPSLALDAPDQLLLAARRGVEVATPVTEALAKARDQALKALVAEGASQGSEALSAAAKHGILVAAMKRALEALHNPVALMLAAREGLLEEATQHTRKARQLTTPGRDALRSLSLREFSSDDQDAIRQAAETGLLLKAVKQALDKDLKKEDFGDRKADSFKVQAGDWKVIEGAYAVTPVLDKDGVSTLRITDPLPFELTIQIEAKINTDDVTPGRRSNAFIIFDYQGPTDFKFAGAEVGTDQWLLGRRTSSGWQADAVLPEPIKPATDYRLRVVVKQRSQVTLFVDEIEKVTYRFSDSVIDGAVGLGTWNALSRFDDVLVQAQVSPAVLGRTARCTVLVRVIKALQLADDQQQSPQDRSGVLADVIRHVLRDCEPASTDRALLLQTGKNAVLARAVREAIAAKNGVLVEAVKNVLKAADASSVSSLVVSRKALAAALARAIETAQLAEAERNLLLLATKSGVLVDALQRVLEDSELAPEDCDKLLQPAEGDQQQIRQLFARAVKRATLAVEQTLEGTDRDALLLAAGCSLLNAELLRAEAREANNTSQLAERVVQAEYDRARAYADRGIELYAGEPRMYSTAADIASRAGQPAEALAVLEAGLLAVRKNASLLWTRANMLIDAEEIVKAQQAVTEFREAVYSYADLQRVPTIPAGMAYLEARIEFAREQWGAAVKGFDKARAGLGSWPTYVKQADFWTGRCYGYLQNEDQELRAYRRALGVDPFYLPARAGLADALAKTGRPDEALKEYGQLLQVGTPAQGAWLRLAQLLYDRNRRLPPAERNWQVLEQALAGAEQTDRDSIQYVLLRAEVLLAQAEEQRLVAKQLDSPAERQKATARAQQIIDDAQGLVQAARDKHPEEVQYWAALVGLAERRQQWDRVETLLDEATKKLGDKVILRVVRATYLADRYGKEATERLRQLAEKTDQFSPAERLQLWNALGAYAEQVGDDQQARELWRRVAEQTPNNLQIRLQLLDLAFRSRDDAGVKSTLDEVQRIEGRGPHWLYGEAVRLSLLAQGKKANPLLDEALKHLAEARTLRPSWARLPLVAATVYEQQGNLSAALESYLQAIDSGESSPLAIRRAISLLYREQRFDKADELLSRFREIPPELLKTAGRIDLGLGRFDQALDKAKQSAAGSNDYHDHIWLGQLLYENGRRARDKGLTEAADNALAQAEKSLRRALELADNVPETWISMILFLAGTGETKKAEEAIEQARSKIPADQRPLALAQAYEQMGRPELAEQNCEEALAAAPQDPAVARYVADFYLRRGEFPQSEPTQRSEAIVRAEAILRRIIDGQVKGTQADALWARRRLAWISLGRFGADRLYPNLEQALKLVEENLKAAGPNPEDLRLKATILSNHPTRARRDEATEILNNLPTEQKTASPQDRFLLWQLYLAQGAWGKAREQMQSLLAADKDRLAYLVAYTAALLERKETQDAELWLTRLEGLAPTNFSTVSLRAELLFQRGQYVQALDLMNRFVGKVDAQPADEAERSRLVSLILERFARRLTEPDQQEMAKRFLFDAEDLCRKYVRQRPGRESFLVLFLGRQNRIEEAVRLLESTWPESDPAVTAEASMLLLRSPTATPEQLQRVERVVQGALQKLDRPIPLLEVMAQACASQERYGEAEAFYREVIKKNSGAYRAMNNLAVLLALQGTKLQDALRLITRAVELAGPVASMLDSRATVYLALDQPSKALDDLEKAIADGATPVRRFHQARAYQQNGQQQDAVEAMKKAQQLGLKVPLLEPLERPAYQELLKLLK